MINGMYLSLQTADVFPVDNFRRERSDDRKYVCSQAIYISLPAEVSQDKAKMRERREMCHVRLSNTVLSGFNAGAVRDSGFRV